MDLAEAKKLLSERQGGLVAPPVVIRYDTCDGQVEVIWINKPPSQASDGSQPTRTTFLLPQLGRGWYLPPSNEQADVPVETVLLTRHDWRYTFWQLEKTKVEIQDGQAIIKEWGHQVAYRTAIWMTDAEWKEADIAG